MTTTFNPSDISGFTLSNGNLTATATGGSYNGVRSTDHNTTGKLYFEFLAGTSNNDWFGIAQNGNWTLNSGSYVGFNTGCAHFRADNGSCVFNGGSTGTDGPTVTSGDIVHIAVNLSTKHIWFGKNGTWSSGDPASDSSPNCTFTTGSPDIYIAYGGFSTSNVATLHASAATATYSPPSGFLYWDNVVTNAGTLAVTDTPDTVSIGATGINVATFALTETQDTFANSVHVPVLTSWNPNDKSASIALSNSNLTATLTSSASMRVVRATGSTNTGKFYAELTPCNELFSPGSSSNFALFGLANLSQSLDPGGGGYLGFDANGWAYYYDSSGGFYRHSGAGASISTGSAAANTDRVMLAVDLDAGKFWFGKNGTWANSGNPAAGTSPIDTFTANTTMAVAWCSGTTSINATINFGNTAFSYTPPAGFASWPTNLNEGSFAVTDTQDIFTFTGTFIGVDTVVFNLVETQDTLTVSGYVTPTNTIVIAVTDTPDSLAISGTYFGNITGTIAVTETADSINLQVQSGTIKRYYVTCGANGTNGTVGSSEDGITWINRATISTSNQLNDILQDTPNGTFVVVGRDAGANGRVYTSTDMDTWTERTLPAGTKALNGLDYHSGRWVAVSVTGQHLYSDNDGVTWAISYTAPFAVYDVKFGNQWVSVGNGGRYWYSTDGTSWTQGTLPSPVAAFGLDYDAEHTKWVAVGSSGHIWSSTSGSTWSLVTTGATNWKQVAYGEGTWVATGGSGTSTAITAKSTDATSWASTTISTTAGILQTVLHNDTTDTWVSAGFKSYATTAPLYTSSDGATWSNQSYPLLGAVYRLTLGVFETDETVSATFAITDIQDTSTFTGIQIGAVAGSFALSESQDILTLTGFSNIDASITFALVEQQDSGAIHVTKVLPDNPGSFALTEGQDALAASGVSVTLRNVVWIVAVETPDAFILGGSSPIYGNFNLTEDADVAAFGQAGAGLAIRLTQDTADQFTTLDAALFNGATLYIYTGNQPDDPQSTPTGSLVGVITLPNPAFGPIVSGKATQVGGPWSGAAAGTGVAGWFRLVDVTGNYSIDGSAGTSGTDLIMSASSVVTGDPLSVTAAFFQLAFV